MTVSAVGKRHIRYRPQPASVRRVLAGRHHLRCRRLRGMKLAALPADFWNSLPSSPKAAPNTRPIGHWHSRPRSSFGDRPMSGAPEPGSRRGQSESVQAGSADTSGSSNRPRHWAGREISPFCSNCRCNDSGQNRLHSRTSNPRVRNHSSYNRRTGTDIR